MLFARCTMVTTPPTSVPLSSILKSKHSNVFFFSFSFKSNYFFSKKNNSVWVQNDVYVESIHKYCGVRVYDYNSPNDYRPDEGVYERDMFICMVPGDETDFPSDMDISGRFSFYFDYQFRDEQNRRDELHYTTAPYYNLMWDFARPGKFSSFLFVSILF